MTLFINLRATTVGGLIAATPQAMWATEGSTGTTPVTPEKFAELVRNRNVILATHGFNVNQQSGIDALDRWSELLPPSYLFVGVLWAGDSKYLPFIDYVYEGVEAIDSGKKLATYLNANATAAQSLSFSSHSLGARMVLETVLHLDPALWPRKFVLMAGAIENDCLVREYANSAEKVRDAIYVIASRSDWVLELAFPPGNLIGEIVMHGHPYDRTALGRDGPSSPLPKVTTWQIPDDWDYGHLDYLPKGDNAPPMIVPKPGPGPHDDPPFPTGYPRDARWKPSWSAGAVTTDLA